MEVVALTGRVVKSVSYDWVINNLSFFTDEKVIESPAFTAGDQFKWKLEIVPKWHEDHQFWRLSILPLTAESITCRASVVLVDCGGPVIKKLTSCHGTRPKADLNGKPTDGRQRIIINFSCSMAII